MCCGTLGVFLDPFCPKGGFPRGRFSSIKRTGQKARQFAGREIPDFGVIPNIGTLAFFGGVGWYNVLGAAGARQHERPYRRTLLMALLLELASRDEANIGGVADGVEVLAVDEGWASVELPSEIPIHSSLGTRDPLTIELSHKPALDGSGSDGEATTSHSDPASMSTVAARGLLFFPFAFSAKPSSELYTESFRYGFIPMSDGEFWHSITRALVLRNQTPA